MSVIFKIIYFLYFLMDFSSEKKRRVGHVYWLVLKSNPIVLQHPLDPPRQRQHQVLHVQDLAVALLQGESKFDDKTSST